MTTTSSARVARFRETQKDAGRRLLTTFVSAETLQRLKTLARGRSIGEAIERLAFQETGTDTESKG